MEGTFRETIPPGCRLIETFRFDPVAGHVKLALHLNRMCDSARKLGFTFQRSAAEKLCAAIRSDVPLRCRLSLGITGDFDLQTQPLAGMPTMWRIGISNVRLDSQDPWLGHKTTQRQIYDNARADLASNLDEVIFMNERDEVCEGTITNIFVTLRDGLCITPPISSGCLPGILRQTMITNRGTVVRRVKLDDLTQAHEIHVGNSLRGLIPAVLTAE